MIGRKDMAIVVLVGFMLAVTFYPKITASQSNMANAGEYDPGLTTMMTERLTIKTCSNLRQSTALQETQLKT